MKQYISLPNGKRCGIGIYANAIREIKKNPNRDYAGWSEGYSVRGSEILVAFGKLVQDKINASLVIPEDKRGALVRLLKRHWANGGRECKWCDNKFRPESVNDQFCGASCRQAYFF